ncbi:MAG: hypothetical protein LBO73_03245 [Holosporaceae bacterium]|jgi:DNA repair photolyase|nr:hypothetical protein [Holosporaceae bacterium]
MSVKEITCKTALHHHDKEFATNWDLNVYRGCGHRCVYCFAQYSHKYLETDRFFDDIFVKTNVAEALNVDFSKRSWNGDPINVCGVTDGYQPIEEDYCLMPKIIKTFIRHKNPLVITTKSTLLLRDINLLEELNGIAAVDVRVSVSAMNESVREKIEPFASPTVDRLRMLGELGKRGIRAGILMMPVIPHLTDDIENLDKIFELVKKNDGKFIFPQILHLRGDTKRDFLDYARKFFPDLEEKIKRLYGSGAYVDKKYAEAFRRKIILLRKKYNFFNELPRNDCRKRETPSAQLTLL